MISLEHIRSAIHEIFPNHEIASLVDRGYWLKDKARIAQTQGWQGSRIIDFTLDTGKRYCMKIHGEQAWDEGYKSEIQSIGLLREHNLPAPEIVFADTSTERIGAAFYIAEYLEGVKWCILWLQVSEQEKHDILKELGRFFQRMNAIHHTESGLIGTDDPYQVRFPGVHPNDHMFKAELKNGSGKAALDAEYLSKETYDAVLNAWEQNMDYLKDHQPSLIHLSPFCWNISFLRQNACWQVSKILPAGEVMWWDPACNLALLKYPPFMRIEESHWQSFLEGYETEIEEKHINLYALLTSLSAAMGVYAEPVYLRNPYLVENLQQEIEHILKTIV